MTVVLAAERYPERARRGLADRRASRTPRRPGALVFHAGTAMRDGQLVTNGGRILNVTGLGDDARGGARARVRGVRADLVPRRALPARHRGQGGERCRLSGDRRPSPIGLLEELDEPGPLVGILVGSESDREAMDPALDELDERGISHELKVLSAHRDPRGSPSTRRRRSCAASG